MALPKEEALWLFHAGQYTHAQEFLGAHPAADGVGAVFRVWAPAAAAVSVIGDFNGWQTDASPAVRVSDAGVWQARVDGARPGDLYKFALQTASGEWITKSDPYGFSFEPAPGCAARYLPDREYDWHDGDWMARRAAAEPLASPLNIYEVHAGSWQRGEDGAPLSYTALAARLAAYCQDMHYTHVELMPLMEYPFDASWGYQVTGYYAPTGRYGSPREFAALVDELHRAGIGVILDWVPAHFPRDDQGLSLFDGGPCYEYADPRKGEHRRWGTKVFDYGRPEVRSFLISNALFWLREYHLDGLRVDAVASMLYLDYDREPGQWQPNRYGGREHLEAVEFLRQLNRAVYRECPDVLMIAEESTAWPLVTRPVEDGGLGFLLKWNMGWMNDMLGYMQTDPWFRSGNQQALTFSFFYAFSENYVLPLSHDEVVHGKRSLIEKMPGEYADKFANLRVLYAYMMAHPGKKLLFMGQEFGQFIEWDYAKGLDWLLLGYDSHAALQRYVRDLNALYLSHPALWQVDCDWQGFCWIANDDNKGSTVAFRRLDRRGGEIIAVCRFIGGTASDYRIGVPRPGDYRVIFCSDEPVYGGTCAASRGTLSTRPVPMHGFDQSLSLCLGPFCALYLEYIGPGVARGLQAKEM